MLQGIGHSADACAPAKLISSPPRELPGRRNAIPPLAAYLHDESGADHPRAVGLILAFLMVSGGQAAELIAAGIAALVASLPAVNAVVSLIAKRSSAA